MILRYVIIVDVAVVVVVVVCSSLISQFVGPLVNSVQIEYKSMKKHKVSLPNLGKEKN